MFSFQMNEMNMLRMKTVMLHLYYDSYLLTCTCCCLVWSDFLLLFSRLLFDIVADESVRYTTSFTQVLQNKGNMT